MEITIYVATLVGLLIILFFGIRERGRIKERIHNHNKAQMMWVADFEEVTLESLHQVPVRLGGYNGASGTLIIGRYHIFFAATSTAIELNRISYKDVVSVEVEQPNLPYVMNLNMAAVITNEQTRQKAGLDLVISYNTPKRIELATFGGFSPHAAFEIRDKVDEAIDCAENVVS